MIVKKELSGKNESGKCALIRNVKFTRSSKYLGSAVEFIGLYLNVDLTNVKLITKIVKANKTTS